MANILTYIEQQQIRPISKNNQSIYDNICGETELSELSDLLGVSLLQDLQNNPATLENIDLLEGCNFVNRNGHTIRQLGIKYILAYLIFSRYINESDIKDTYAGMVNKRTEYSDSMSSGRIKSLQEQYKKVAMSVWQTTREYLDLNAAKYPLWLVRESHQIFEPKFNGVKKTLSSNISQSNYDWKTRTYLK